MATRGIRCCLLAPVLLQVACATSGGSAQPVTPMTAVNLGRIGLATGHGEPSYAFQALVEGKGEGTADGALGGAAACLDLLLSGGDPTVAAAFAVVCLPVAMVAGAIRGGTGAAPARSVDEARDRAQAGIAALRLNESLRQLLLEQARLVGLEAQVLDQEAGPAGPADAPDYASLADRVDSVLELNVQQVEATSGWGDPVPVSFTIRAQVRLIDVRDGRVLDSYVASYAGMERPVDEWFAADGAALQADLNASLQKLAANAVDDFMIYRPTPPAESSRASGERVPGYAIGLVDPPLRARFKWPSLSKQVRCGADYDGGPTYGLLEQFPLDTLQPTFRWEALPRDFDLAPGDGPGQAQGVQYDFRLFGANGVVHERFGLDEPLHTLEEPLATCAEFRWTVRARFTLDGRQRATEWTGGYNTIGGYVDPMWIRRRPGKPALAAIPDDVTQFFAIVQTPDADGAPCKCQ
jgi:hypothetical protein